jgi:histidyl-tRNA synthetase
MKDGRMTMKDMNSGEQKTLTWEQLKDKLMS